MRQLLKVIQSTPVRIIFLVLALGAAVWAITTQWDEVSSSLRSISPFVLFAALLVGIVYVFLTLFAWKALLEDMGTKLPFRAASAIFFVSQLGKYLPGGVWNILAAAELGADHQIPRRRSVSVMVVSVVISIVTGLGLAAALLPFTPSGIASEYGWAFVTLPVFLVMLLPPVLNRLLGAALKVTGRPALEHPVSWRGMSRAALWTLLAWVVAGLQVWLIATGIGLATSPATFVLCTAGYALAWTVGFLVVFVPAGAGVREAVLAVVLAGSLTTGGVVTVVLLSRLVLTVADLLLGGAGLYLARRAAK